MRFQRLAILVLIVVAVMAPVDSRATHAQGTPAPGNADAICAEFVATPEAEEELAPADVDLAGLEFDVIFLEAMIPHHQSAIDLATIVLERSEKQELKDLAQSLIELRSVEVAIMTGWRSEWYADVPQLTELQLVDAMNIKLAESPGVGGVAGLEEMGADHVFEDIRALCEAGADLDRAYIDTMLAHNSSAIILSGEAIGRAVHREIKNLGESNAVQQQYEIDQLLTWRDIWFAGTPIPDHHDG